MRIYAKMRISAVARLGVAGFLFLAAIGISQPNSDSLIKGGRFYISISGGSAIPLGKFTERKDDNGTGENYAGVPKLGGNIRIEGDYFPEKYFGISFSYYYTFNKASDVNLGDLYPTYAMSGMGNHSSMTALTYNSSYWYTKNFMPGLLLQLKEDRIKMVFRISVGFQEVLSPKTVITGGGVSQQTYTQPPVLVNCNFTTTQPAMRSANFVAGAGIDLSLNIFKTLGLVLSCGILNSYATFNAGIITNTYYNGSKPDQTYTYSNVFNKNVRLALFNAGIVYTIK